MGAAESHRSLRASSLASSTEQEEAATSVESKSSWNRSRGGCHPGGSSLGSGCCYKSQLSSSNECTRQEQEERFEIKESKKRPREPRIEGSKEAENRSVWPASMETWQRAAKSSLPKVSGTRVPEVITRPFSRPRVC